MNISAFIGQRIAFNRQKSFSRFIIRLSVVATTISVTVMVITLSFVSGFEKAVSDKVFSFWGHVRIAARQPQKAAIAEEEPIRADPALVASVQRMQGVKSIQAFATKSAILKTETDLDGVLMKGLGTDFSFQNLQPFLQAGRWLHFNDSTYSREIVLSTFTAGQLHLKIGDRVLIYFVRPDGSLRPDRLTVVGLYKTGVEEYDKSFALGDIKLLRRLNGWNENEIGGYEIFLNDYDGMQAVSDEIYELPNFPPLWATATSKELYPDIFDWLHIVGYNGKILIGIVIAIVIINFITCLFILVLERIRMIGVLKAVGATDWSVQKIFIYHSLFITITGIVAGTIISLLLLFLQQKTGFIKLKEAEYYMNTAAVDIDPVFFITVCGGTMLLSFLVLLIPSLLIKKINPITAIRFR